MNRYIRQIVLAILVSFLLPQRSEAQSGNDNRTGVAGEWNGSITTGGSYDPYTGNASRVVEDMVVVGSVGAYPLKWTHTLNTRGAPSPNFGASGWSHSYDWNLSVRTRPGPTPEPSPGYEGPDGAVSYPDGRRVDVYEPWNPGGCAVSANGPFGVDDRLIDLDGLQHDYDLFLGDGGKVKFRWQQYSNGGGTARASLAREIIDPYGQSTTLDRDPAGKLIKVTEPAGRYLQINYRSYHGQFRDIDLIDSVKAFDGLGHLTQTVTYSYTPYIFYHNYSFFYLTGVTYWPDPRKVDMT